MKKVLSVFLSFVMVLGMLPMTALADSTDEAVPEVTEKIEAIAEPQEDISETEESIYVSDGSVEITDGTFTSLEDGDSALYISDSAEAVLTGGIFAAGGNVCAFDGTVDGDAIKGLTMPATTLTPSRFALLQPAEQKKTRFPSARH